MVPQLFKIFLPGCFSVCSAYVTVIRYPLVTTYVATYNEIPVAYIMCEIKKSGSELYLMSLAVCSLFRQRGLGHILLGKAIEEAKNNGAKCVTLHVNVENSTAQALYKRFGFVQEKFCPAYYAGTKKHCKDGYKLILHLVETV